MGVGTGEARIEYRNEWIGRAGPLKGDGASAGYSCGLGPQSD